MKLKLAIAACAAALALPMAPAQAQPAEGQCYTTRAYPTALSWGTSYWDCECIAGAWLVGVDPSWPAVWVGYCHMGDRII